MGRPVQKVGFLSFLFETEGKKNRSKNFQYAIDRYLALYVRDKASFLFFKKTGMFQLMRDL